MTPPRVAVGPYPSDFATDAVRDGGGEVVDLADRPDCLVWLDPSDVAGLTDWLAEVPDARWVQLPFAGVERVAEAGLLDDERIWTCAKGAYAEPVAEHALTLALAGLRHLPARVVARSWGIPAGTSLYDQKVTILGGGGIATSLLEQLAPFRVDATVVRRTPDPVPGATRTLSVDRLHESLGDALVVVLALALTPDTAGIIGAAELDVMPTSAWLVNVARGGHVDTGALVAALAAGSIAGAALDVTEPEPLPDGHPLWDLDNCIVTPHTADTIEMVVPLLADRIRTNVRCLVAGEPLVGRVDASAGY
ncbi:MAG TPA: D-isomer specific 2-hydroxyacid dehydrogenase family protein [Acidimicrobiales bacterium]